VVEIVQRNGEEGHRRDGNFHELIDASFGQVDPPNRLDNGRSTISDPHIGRYI
jgi:hypothetical protein